MLKMGSSKPWPEAMNVITKQRKMDAQALLDYFKPLTDFLLQENKAANDTVGWTDSCPSLDEEGKFLRNLRLIINNHGIGTNLVFSL